MLSVSLLNWRPWEVALVTATLCFVLMLLARMRLAKARDDYADAFFYSPSLKTAQRARRQRWQDRYYTFLAGTLLGLLAAAWLYVAGPR